MKTITFFVLAGLLVAGCGDVTSSPIILSFGDTWVGPTVRLGDAATSSDVTVPQDITEDPDIFEVPDVIVTEDITEEPDSFEEPDVVLSQDITEDNDSFEVPDVTVPQDITEYPDSFEEPDVVLSQDITEDNDSFEEPDVVVPQDITEDNDSFEEPDVVIIEDITEDNDSFEEPDVVVPQDITEDSDSFEEPDVGPPPIVNPFPCDDNSYEDLTIDLNGGGTPVYGNFKPHKGKEKSFGDNGNSNLHFKFDICALPVQVWIDGESSIDFNYPAIIADPGLPYPEWPEELPGNANNSYNQDELGVINLYFPVPPE